MNSHIPSHPAYPADEDPDPENEIHLREQVRQLEGQVMTGEMLKTSTAEKIRDLHEEIENIGKMKAVFANKSTSWK